MVDLISKYKLSEEEHKKVLESLKKEIFINMISEKNPSIMFVIGQPGCGKTTYIEKNNLSKYIVINSDNYRKFNKYSKEILDKYPTEYSKLTNYDAHLWGDELFNYAIQNSYTVLREKAPTDLSLLDLIKTIPDNYEVVINVVIRGNLSSLLATRERYEQELMEKNNAKLSNIESHNKCYNLLPEFISRCLLLGVKVNYVTAEDYKYNIITVKDNYLDILKKLRQKSNNKAILNYDRRMKTIKESMTKRNAPLNQFNELEKIEATYSEIKREKC